VRQRKSCGSALKFGVIAAGEADLYPRFGTTMEWDTAAGQTILEAAGGRVETLNGTPLAYGKPGFKNDGFLAWGRRGLTGLARSTGRNCENRDGAVLLGRIRLRNRLESRQSSKQFPNPDFSKGVGASGPWI